MSLALISFLCFLKIDVSFKITNLIIILKATSILETQEGHRSYVHLALITHSDW